MERGSLVQLEKTPHWVTLLLSPPAELQCVCKVSELGRRQKGNRNNFKGFRIYKENQTYRQRYTYTVKDIHADV